MTLNPGKYVVVRGAAGRLDPVVPGDTRVRATGTGLGAGGWAITLASRPGRRPATTSATTGGDEDGRQVQRPERQRRQGRGRARLAGLDDQRLRDTNGNGILSQAEMTTSRPRPRHHRRGRRLPHQPQARQVHRVRGAAGRLDPVVPGGNAVRRCRARAPAAGPSPSRRASSTRTTTSATTGARPRAGMKFNDLNANGVKDAGEPGLAGWTIQRLRGHQRQRHPAGDRDDDADLRRHRPTPAAPTRSRSTRASTWSARCTRPAGSSRFPPAPCECRPGERRRPGGYAITLTPAQLDPTTTSATYQNGHEVRHEVRGPERQRREDAGEPGLAGWTIHAYADTNGDGILEATETTIAGAATTTHGAARRLLAEPQARQVRGLRGQQANWIQSLPDAASVVGHRPGLRASPAGYGPSP